MAELDILLPSLRRDAALQRIREFEQTSREVDYRIILVSPFAVNAPRVLHLEEREARGGIHALDTAYQHSTAPYIACWSDDASPTSLCLARMLEFVKRHDDPFVGGFRLRDRHEVEVEQRSVYGKLYVGWLLSSRRTLDLVGGFFDPVFRRFWADADLSMRVWTNGGCAEVCPDGWVVVEHIEDDVKTDGVVKHFESDAETFLNRWHERLGAGWEKKWTAINRPVPPHDPGGCFFIRPAHFLRKIRNVSRKLFRNSPQG